MLAPSSPAVDVREVEPAALGRTLVAAGAASGELRALRARPVQEWPGGMSELLRLELDWHAGDGPATLVAKQAAAGENTRATAAFMCMYEREVRFYERLAARCPLPPPACYHAAFDGATQRFLLLLDDRGGDRALDELAGCAIDDARAVVSVMGALHGAFCATPPRELDDTQLPALGTPWYAERWTQLLAATWEAAATTHADLTDASTRALGDALAGGAARGVLERLSTGPRTLCHGDLRADNLLAAADGVVRAVDWQLMHHSRGVCDLGYFLAVSLEPDVRRRHHDELIALYADAGGAHAPDPAMLHDELPDAVAAAFMIPAIASAALDLQDARGVAVCRTMYRRAAACAADLGCVDRLAA